jgi:hypothetical protein
MGDEPIPAIHSVALGNAGPKRNDDLAREGIARGSAVTVAMHQTVDRNRPEMR